MSPCDLHHLSGSYALDALDGAEREEFERHHPHCEICSREVAQFRATAAVLAAAVEAEPPADLRSRVLAQVSRTRQLSPLVPAITSDDVPVVTDGPDDGAVTRPHRSAADELAARRGRRPDLGRWLAGAAAAVLVAVAGLTLWARWPGDDGPRGDEVAVSEVLEASDAKVSALDVVGAETAGSLRVIWSQDLGRVAVVGNDLQAAGEGWVYELWFIESDGAAVPAGLFQPDGAGAVRAVLETDSAVTATEWGVTVEPQAGSMQPTSDVLYSGDI